MFKPSLLEKPEVDVAANCLNFILNWKYLSRVPTQTASYRAVDVAQLA